ncbi:hypothetical protein DFH27DRAFT_185905 [Peziza echinospora]|nr:hypothetical protein DFH27DRAFT_185905 [Peziza echinospora]
MYLGRFVTISPRIFFFCLSVILEWRHRLSTAWKSYHTTHSSHRAETNHPPDGIFWHESCYCASLSHLPPVCKWSKHVNPSISKQYPFQKQTRRL